jgi:transcriptional regulator with XRE-family HTH domain
MSDGLITSVSDWRAAVKERIAERRLSHEQVEHDAKIGASYLSKLLTGKKEPTLPTLERLLSALGLSLVLSSGPERETHHESR